MMALDDPESDTLSGDSEPKLQLPPVGLTLTEQITWIQQHNPTPNPFTQPNYQQQYTEAISQIAFTLRDARRKALREFYDDGEFRPDHDLMDAIEDFLKPGG